MTSHPQRWQPHARNAVNRGIARRLARLDAAMRAPELSPQRAVSTRVAFFLAATRAGAAASLNAVGDLVPESLLSERSLDWVFECGAVSDAAVIAIVRRCRRDSRTRATVAAAGFARSLVDWEAFAVRAVGSLQTGELFA